MIKKIIGIILLALGVLGIFILLTYGGPIFPHIFGPTVVTIIGGAVFAIKQKAK